MREQSYSPSEHDPLKPKMMRTPDEVDHEQGKIYNGIDHDVPIKRETCFDPGQRPPIGNLVHG